MNTITINTVKTMRNALENVIAFGEQLKSKTTIFTISQVITPYEDEKDEVIVGRFIEKTIALIKQKGFVPVRLENFNVSDSNAHYGCTQVYMDILAMETPIQNVTSNTTAINL